MDANDLVNRFRFHPATERTGPLHNSVREKCWDLAQELNSLVPEGREKALMVTKLEEVMFWANAGIARNKND